MIRRETYLTQEGLSKLEKELGHLSVARRQEVAQRIQKAKEIGGTVDNAEYDEAKNEQAFVEGRILALESMLKTVVIIPNHAPSSGTVEIGSRVTVVNHQGEQQNYTIVGSAEADPTQGKISNESPIGGALLGKRVGEEAEARIPSGSIKITIVTIE